MKTHVVFMHGLNTYGDDDLHIGPLKFGRMAKHWERALIERGVSTFAIDGMGAGSALDQAERVLIDLEKRGLVQKERTENRDLVLFGHSVGGLVARVLAHHPVIENRVQKIITIGTPHLGAPIAEFGIEFEKAYPVFCRALAALGYDTRKKAETFQHFTTKALEDFNKRFPPRPEIQEYSLLCRVGPEDLSLALRPFASGFHPLGERFRKEASDGFIFCESQCRGEVLGPYALDHYAMLGFFFHLSRSKRQRAQQEFERLVTKVTELVSI